MDRMDGMTKMTSAAALLVCEIDFPSRGTIGLIPLIHPIRIPCRRRWSVRGPKRGRSVAGPCALLIADS
jgi:hypothetical protein